MDKTEQEIEKNKENAVAIFKVAMFFIVPLTAIGVYFKSDIILLINKYLNVDIGLGELSFVYLMLCLIAIKVAIRKTTTKGNVNKI